MKGLPGQAPQLDLSATQIQLLKSRCSNSLRIALKVCLNSSPMRVSQIREETDKDTTLLALHEIIMHVWPEKRSNCPASLHAYWNYRDEPTVADGLILKGTRIVIPESLQPDILISYTMPIKVLRNASSWQRDQYSGQTSTVILRSWSRAAPMSASPEAECQGTLAVS